MALATPEHAKITVLGIAKIYGTSLGLPHPGLQPTHTEWDLQREWVHGAADELRALGFDVRVGLARSRNIAKMIAKWCTAKNFHAIVIPDPARPGWRKAVEGDITAEIGRKCSVPVHAIPVPSPGGRARRRFGGTDGTASARSPTLRNPRSPSFAAITRNSCAVTRASSRA